MGVEETRVSTLMEELQRRMSLAVADHEEVAKRQGSEANQQLELRREKTCFLEQQRKQLEAWRGSSVDVPPTWDKIYIYICNILYYIIVDVYLCLYTWWR